MCIRDSNYTGEPEYLKDTFPILVSFIYDEVYSDDKRYVVRVGCKPRDCGNNGMLWVDLKEKVAIGVIDHSFWEKFGSEMIKDQMPPIRKGLWGAYKEILPALMKQKEDSDYFFKKEVPDPQNA